MAKTAYLALATETIHPGHLKIIKRASSLGKVVVGILTDEAIVSYKQLPNLSFEDRCEIARSIIGVDLIVPQETLDYSNNLKKYKPEYLIHGDDWRTGLQSKVREKAINTLKEWGGELIEIPYSNEYVNNLSSLPYGLGTPEYRRLSLRKLLNTKDILRFLDVHNPLSALVVEKVMLNEDLELKFFDGMWGSSLTDSTAKGKPDIEAVDPTSRLTTLNDILEVTTKPVIYDADTGGKIEHFNFTVRSLERMGVSAVIIEDKKGLKKNSLLGNDVPQTQDDIDSFCKKIKSGKKAQITNEFMLIARIESLILNKGIDDAITRAEAYIKAGADGIMIHSRKKEPDEIFEFIDIYNQFIIRKPLVVVPSSYNKVTETELLDKKVNIVIYANHLLRAAYPAMVNTAESILKHGRSLEADKNLLSISQVLKLIPGTE